MILSGISRRFFQRTMVRLGLRSSDDTPNESRDDDEVGTEDEDEDEDEDE